MIESSRSRARSGSATLLLPETQGEPVVSAAPGEVAPTVGIRPVEDLNHEFSLEKFQVLHRCSYCILYRHEPCIACRLYRC